LLPVDAAAPPGTGSQADVASRWSAMW
jgi:hypothetical protein